jgi:hypothetical protein
MKKLVVLEGNCVGEGPQYRAWLEKNLPEDIELDYREGVRGYGGGMFDADGVAIKSPVNWWEAYCDYGLTCDSFCGWIMKILTR